MTKKIIALIEVLMVISIISTGYASWLYVRPHSMDAYTQDNNVISYEAEKQNLESYGIYPLANTEATSQGLSVQSFRYITQNGTEKLTSNTISMWFRMTPASMVGEGKDYNAGVMLLTCTAKAGNNPVSFVSGKDADGNDVTGIDYWLQMPTHARLVVSGFENRALQSEIVVQDGSLVMRFSVAELYHMLSACEGRNTFFVELSLEFSQTRDTYDASLPLRYACAYNYSFSAVLRPNV